MAVLCACVSAQQKPIDQLTTMPKGEIDMIKVLLAQERAWNSGDMTGYVSGYKYSKDTVLIGRNFTRGYDDILASYQKSYPDAGTMGKLGFSNLEPHLLDPGHGTMVGIYKLERAKKFGGNAEGVFSLVLEKTPDGWKIILDHTT